jgi:HSP20 family protein
MTARVLWDPWHDIDRLQQEVNRLFARATDRPDAATGAVLRPAMIAQEAEEGYWLTFDVPGVSAEALSLEVQDNVVQMKGERTTGGYKARYERTLQLPETADADDIKAELRDGVLSLFVPKRPQARPRRIQIAGGAQLHETTQIDAGAANGGRVEEQELAGASA